MCIIKRDEIKSFLSSRKNHKTNNQENYRDSKHDPTIYDWIAALRNFPNIYKANQSNANPKGDSQFQNLPGFSEEFHFHLTNPSKTTLPSNKKSLTLRLG